MVEISLMDLVIVTVSVLVSLSLICCLCCICIKCSDLQMKSYIIKMAKRKGVKIELEDLDPKNSKNTPTINENCSIFVPEVGIIL